MARFAPDAVLDVMLTKIATATRMTICSGQPANFAGIAAVSLADVVMTPGDGNDFNIANGDVSGRKVSTVAKLAISIVNPGTITHICLDDGVDLLFVTLTVSQVVAALDSRDIPSWDIESRDPV